MDWTDNGFLLVGAIVSGLLIIIAGTFLLITGANYSMENNMCNLTVAGVEYQVPQYRLTVESAGDTTKVLVYTNATKTFVKKAFVGRDVKITCDSKQESL